jgi:hypothetical protein
MAILYRADLRPTKLELLAAWLPGRPWFPTPASGGLTRVAAYRFDDPDGEVGIETFLVRAGDGGPLVQVPLTYRGAPLDGGDRWLVGTMEHSVLGQRWAYDACGDPVYAATLAEAILGGGREAEEFVDVGGRLEPRGPGMSVRGTGAAGGPVAIRTVGRVDDGDPTVIGADPIELIVRRVLDGTDGTDGDTVAGSPALIGTWPGQPTPVPLAYARTT